MQTTRVDSLDRTIQKTNEWLNDVQRELGSADRHEAYSALRSTLQTLRDRLQPNEALDLGSQLPTLVRGIYYESWKLVDRPVLPRTREEFLGAVRNVSGNAAFDAERAVRAVFAVLAARVTAGEIDDIQRSLPAPIRELWER